MKPRNPLEKSSGSLEGNKYPLSSVLAGVVGALTFVVLIEGTGAQGYLDHMGKIGDQIGRELSSIVNKK